MLCIKKIILIILIITPTIIFSQSKKISRWSFMPEYGYNVFDGDINQDLLNVIPTSFRDITFGANIEYALTPTWGLGIDAYYFPLRAKNNSPTAMYINTDLVNSDFLATINFTRLIFPNTKSKLFVLGSIGMGLAYYTYDIRYFPSNDVIPDDATYVDVKYNGQVRPIHLTKSGVMKYGVSVSTPITFSLEYNFSKPLAVGAKVHYRAYAKDNLEGATYLNWDGVTNDYIGAGTVYLRYKFNSIKRDHLRNLTHREWDPDPSLAMIDEVKKDMAGLKRRVDTVEKKVKDLIPRVKKLEDLIANVGPDSDNDGVIDLRDLDPNTPPNTVVDFYGKTLPIQVQKEQKNQRNKLEIPDDIPAVYFDFDRTELDNDALITISKVASQMRKDTSLLVEVRGYCDFLGDMTYNESLSQRRSDRVKRELVKIWGIAEDRIIPNGKGKIILPQMKYRPNRRCEFFFSNDIVDVLNQ
jgi:outer membrane protein OmpA-like peptidoglycan-associated protein